MRLDFSEIEKKIKIFHSVGRYESAEKLLLSTLDEYGAVASLHNLLGVTYHRESKFADAIIQFTKALKINPKYIEAGLNLSATYCDLGLYVEAKATISTVQSSSSNLSRQPELVMGRLANLHAGAADLYAESGMSSEAIHEYVKALSLYDRMPDVKIKLGREYFKLGQYDKAIAEFQDSARLFPNESTAYTWLGICLWKQNRQGEARQAWQAAQKIEGASDSVGVLLSLTKELSASY